MTNPVFLLKYGMHATFLKALLNHSPANHGSRFDSTLYLCSSESYLKSQNFHRYRKTIIIAKTPISLPTLYAYALHPKL